MYRDGADCCALRGYTLRKGFMISHRLWRTLTAVAALALILSFFLFQLHAVAVPACFVLLPFFFIGLIPIPVLFVRWDLLNLGDAPDAPTLSASFQRPPPLRLS
jgi:hypothetical protein